MGCWNGRRSVILECRPDRGIFPEEVIHQLLVLGGSSKGLFLHEGRHRRVRGLRS